MDDLGDNITDRTYCDEEGKRDEDDKPVAMVAEAIYFINCLLLTSKVTPSNE